MIGLRNRVLALYRRPLTFAVTLRMSACAGLMRQLHSDGTTTDVVVQIGDRTLAGVGETGLASIDVTYSVKPCDATPVTVTTRVAEWFDPTAIAWDDAAAPLSGKFTVFGIRLRTTYRVAVEVRSAVDGSLLGSQQVGVAAVPKGV